MLTSEDFLLVVKQLRVLLSLDEVHPASSTQAVVDGKFDSSDIFFNFSRFSNEKFWYVLEEFKEWYIKL